MGLSACGRIRARTNRSTTRDCQLRDASGSCDPEDSEATAIPNSSRRSPYAERVLHANLFFDAVAIVTTEPQACSVLENDDVVARKPLLHFTHAI